MTEIKSGRLLRLAALLDKHQDDDGPYFDLDGWGRYTSTGFFRRSLCDATACAVGLACISGEFNTDGLRYERTVGKIYPVFAGKDGWNAVTLFFGINIDDAEHLFCVTTYDGATNGPDAAKAVAARIRDYVAANDANAAKADKTAETVEAIKKAALAPVE